MDGVVVIGAGPALLARSGGVGSAEALDPALAGLVVERAVLRDPLGLATEVLPAQVFFRVTEADVVANVLGGAPVAAASSSVVGGGERRDCLDLVDGIRRGVRCSSDVHEVGDMT